MDGWGDQGVNYNQEVKITRPNNSYRKPPLGGNNSNWQQSVPTWEKKFCALVGSVPWKKLVETKKFIHLYENVIKWNDSAGKEAFQIAKNNFYANIHGLPCNNHVPDPDIYIDKIDWNSEIDPNLILDLDSDSVIPDSDSKEEVVIFGSSFPPSYQNFSPYGWGDSDDDKKKDQNTSREEFEGGGVDKKDSWWGWNENKDEFYSDVNKERDGNMSRYKTTRFSRNDNRSQSRRNGGSGRRAGGGSQAWKAAYGCAPVNQGGGGGGGGHRWSVKKPVS